jgi:large subunit ribosomal protein L4
MKLDLIDQTGQKVGRQEVELSVSSSIDLKKVILSRLANQHQKTAAVKGRSQVAGSGRKPWRQKGTGRARAGTQNSPLWIGGGVIFGPHPSQKIKKINKKENRLAKRTLLAQKIKNQDVVLIDDFKLDKPETKTIAKLLDRLNFTPKKVIFVISKPDKTLRLSCRNIANLSCKLAKDLSLLDLARHQKIILFKSALKTLL